MTPPISPRKASAGGAATTAAAADHTTLQPVSLLDSPAATTISYVRPMTYLALLALRFGSLVADPVTEMKYSLAVLAVGQTVYAVACLPIAGSDKAKTAGRKARPGEKRRSDGVSAPHPVPSVIFSLVLALLVTPLLHVLLVLLGAPFLAYTPHTLLLAAHLSLLGLLPTFYARGVDTASLLALAGCAAPLDETVGGLLGGLLGAWLGAVPIPLDWDRAWQRWPVTVLVGTYAGGCLGAVVGGKLVFGWRVFAPVAATTTDEGREKKVQ